MALLVDKLHPLVLFYFKSNSLEPVYSSLRSSPKDALKIQHKPTNNSS